MTLTDFLLARIAEDEDSLDEMLRTGDHSWWSHQRMMAECEGKRRIVELHGPHGVGPDLPCRELAAIAAVYADHRDYREEWRP